MENIDQLKQDNAKLTERLNNAAKFFREQKAQIETLAKEKEDLNKQCNEYELKLQDVEKKLEERINNLRSVENTTNEEVKKVTIARDEWIEKYRKLEEQFKEQEKFESDVINTKVPELETKLKNAEAAYEDLRKKYTEIKDNSISKEVIDEKDAEIKNLTSLGIDYVNQINDLKKQIETSKQVSGETNKKIEELRESNKMLQDNAAKLSNDIKTYYDKFNSEHLIVEEDKKQIQDLNDKLTKRQEECELLDQQLTDAKGDREAFRSQLVDLEKKYDQLNNLYDACEAEKLSVQADCEQLQEKIKSIEANNISDKEWQDHLENVIKQIQNLTDDIINPKSVNKENKENIMKRTGDYNVAGQNIGV